MANDPLPRLRRICMAFPQVVERLSHGEPAWFVQGKKTFVMYADRHHDDRVAFWCAAPPGAQDVLVRAEPDVFFVPPYVGYRGWLGVRVDGAIEWAQISELVRDAYLAVAPTRLLAQFRKDNPGT